MRKVLSFFRRHPVSSIIVILLLYVAIGALAPFAVPGQLSVDEKTFSKEDYYTEDPDALSADRAHIVEREVRKPLPRGSGCWNLPGKK